MIYFHLLLCSYISLCILFLTDTFVNGILTVDNQLGGNLNLKMLDLDYGYALCGSEKQRLDILRMHYQIRYTWNSSKPILVAHCSELLQSSIDYFERLDPSIIVFNICPGNQAKILGKSLREAHKRFRGFFCKVAALIKSPFNNTMILDSDTIWFSNPENLFNSKAFMTDGSLFFRDRVFHYVPSIGKMAYDELEDLYLEKYYSGYHTLDSNQSFNLFHSNGVSLFWGNIADRTFPQLNEHQDSSCIVLNKARHPKLLKQLTDWIYDFNLGYGDKEIYWISATLQQESFTWEPFLAGQYGDCFGLILHYNPDDVDNPEESSPLYINAEYMIEKETIAVGDFLRDVATSPILAIEAVTNRHNALKDFATYDKPMSERGCTCLGVYKCKRFPSHVNQYVVLSQWVMLSFRINQESSKKNCIPVHSKLIGFINKIFFEGKGIACDIIGCPRLPVNYSSDVKGITCVPVYFDKIPPNEMNDETKSLRLF